MYFYGEGLHFLKTAREALRIRNNNKKHTRSAHQSLGRAESDLPLAYARIDPIEAEERLPSIRSNSEGVEWFDEDELLGCFDRLRAACTSFASSLNASAIVDTCSAAATSAK